VDFSFLPEIEEAQTVYYDGTGKPADPLKVLLDSGCNMVRMRIWHTQAGGLSYYPIWHGKDLGTVVSSISNLGKNNGKKVIIAETSYPFTFDWNDMTHNVIGLSEQILPQYSATPQGQKNFLLKIKSIMKNDANGLGFCYWGGEWVAYRGPEALDGSSWENQALFDFNNKALPVIGSFAE
jgi:arabinogalactan endo-1,4-beta-galactosidase